jgi:hypothetical protein
MQASVPLCKGILEEWSAVHLPAPFSFRAVLSFNPFAFHSENREKPFDSQGL